MNEYNPYQASPSAGPAFSASGNGGVTPVVIAHLSRTKFWVQFLGVLGIIGSVIIILGVLGFMVAGASVTSSLLGAGANVSGAAVNAGGVVYLAIGALYLFISIKLFGYGSAIGQLRLSGQVQHLELALDRQRSVWKSIGVIAMVMLVFWVLAIIAAVLFGLSVARQAPGRGSLLPTPSGSATSP